MISRTTPITNQSFAANVLVITREKITGGAHAKWATVSVRQDGKSESA